MTMIFPIDLGAMLRNLVQDLHGIGGTAPDPDVRDRARGHAATFSTVAGHVAEVQADATKLPEFAALYRLPSPQACLAAATEKAAGQLKQNLEVSAMRARLADIDSAEAATRHRRRRKAAEGPEPAENPVAVKPAPQKTSKQSRRKAVAKALAVLVALGAGSMLGGPVRADSAPAQSYLSLGGGLPVYWTSRNDQSELEGGANWPPTLNNWRVDLEGGRRYPGMIAPTVDARFGGNLVYQSNYVHGDNGPDCDRDDCSADDLHDNTLQGGMAFATAWADWHAFDRVTLYLGGGPGAGYFHALGDDAVAFVVQGGAGANFAVADGWSVDLGARVITAPADFQIDGKKVEYTTITPRLALTWTGDLF